VVTKEGLGERTSEEMGLHAIPKYTNPTLE